MNFAHIILRTACSSPMQALLRLTNVLLDIEFIYQVFFVYILALTLLLKLISYTKTKWAISVFCDNIQN